MSKDKDYEFDENRKGKTTQIIFCCLIFSLLFLLFIPATISGGNPKVNIKASLNYPLSSNVNLVYPKEITSIKLDVQIVETVADDTVGKLNPFYLLVTDESNNPLPWWNEISGDYFEFEGKTDKIKTGSLIGRLRTDGGPANIRYYWEVQEYGTGHLIIFRTMPPTNYYINPGYTLEIETPKIKIPYTATFGSSYNVQVMETSYIPRPDTDKKIGSLTLEVKNKSDIVEEILKDTWMILAILSAIALVIGPRYLGRIIRNELIAIAISALVPIVLLGAYFYTTI